MCSLEKERINTYLVPLQCVCSEKQRRLSILPCMLRMVKPEIMRVCGAAKETSRRKKVEFAQVFEGCH